MPPQLTAAYRLTPDGYRGRVLEMPGVEAAAATMPAARRQLAAALQAAMQRAAEDHRRHWGDFPEIFREPLLLFLNGFAEGHAAEARKLLATGVYVKDGRWYLAYVAEIPGAFTQGETFGEARRNLRESLQLILECNREAAEAELASRPPAGIMAPAFPVPSA